MRTPALDQQMQHLQSSSKFVFYLVHLVACIFLLLPAFYNGFGMVNSDFGTYLPSGFKPEMPVDRPITYGILLRIFSLNGLSLWLVLVAQAYLVANLIIRLIKHLRRSKHHLLLSLGVIALLSLGTGLSWTVSQLQPDVFTGIAFMCMAVLLLAKENRTTTILTCVLYFVAVGTHFSHVMIFLLLLGAVSIIYRRRILREKKSRLALLVVLTITPIVTMLTPMSKSKHVFMMGSLMEKGLLKKYLDNTCNTETSYRLCHYKDKLPVSGDDFIWEAGSPVYSEGGWAVVKPEYNRILSDIFSSPEYIWLFTKASISATAMQLVTFDIGCGNSPFSKDSYVYDGISQYTPQHIERFRESRQQQGDLVSHFVLPNRVFSMVMLVSAVCMAALLAIKRKEMGKDALIFALMCILAILVNAWDCGTFSSVNDRYGCRIMWLIPFCACILMYLRIAGRKKVR